MFKILSLLCLCGTICLTGCFSIEVAKEPGNRQQIIASNYGWYLFDFIPLCCGDPDEDWIIPCTFFRDRVTMDDIQARLIKKARKSGKTVENLVWNNNDSVLMTIPFLDIPLPIPYIITYHEMQLSGEVKR